MKLLTRRSLKKRKVCHTQLIPPKSLNQQWISWKRRLIPYSCQIWRRLMGARNQTRDHPQDKAVKREKIKATTKDITGVVINKAVAAATQTMGATDMTTDTGATREADNGAIATAGRTGGQTQDQGQMEIEEPHTAITTPTIMETGLTLTMAGIILKIIGAGKTRDQGAKSTNITTITTRATTGKTVGRTTGREAIVATDKMVTQVTSKIRGIIITTDLGQEKRVDMKTDKMEAERGHRKEKGPQ